DHALEMSARLVDHPGLAQRIGRCRSAVAAGVAFSDALSDTGVFSGLSARMISIGFKTGSVDTVMCKLAVRYEENIDAGLSRLIGVVEPTMVAILSIAVGMVLLSVMLPLMGIMSSIG
ncbi:MAG: type II secretion system F family protein, partial [Oscillospiraceae bacterium]